MDTLQFLLFLYVQQFHNVSLRRSLLGDEWPSPRTKSPSLSEKSAIGNKVLVPPALSVCRSLLTLRGVSKGLVCSREGFTREQSSSCRTPVP